MNLQVKSETMVLQNFEASMDVRASQKVIRLKVDKVTNPNKLGSGLLAELGNGCPHHLVLCQVQSSNHTFEELLLFCLHQTY